jgi:P pilus assembly chaperone PapD
MTRYLIAALGAGLALVGAARAALADPTLLVSPTRVVFDDARRTAVLTLLNNGNEAGTYRLFLVHYRMTPTGGFEEVTEPTAEDKATDAMIRFTPKQVVLPPKQTQVVRVQLRLPADLAAGEYRTHLLFRVLPAVPPAGQAGDGKRGISIRLVPAVGVSIPLIFRHGQTAATAGLSQLALLPPQQDGKARLGLHIQRQGNQSVYGNLVAVFHPAGGGAAREVGRANGIAVYMPNTDRQAILPLAVPPGAIAHGTVEVRFQEPEADGKVLAKSELHVP